MIKKGIIIKSNNVIIETKLNRFNLLHLSFISICECNLKNTNKCDQINIWSFLHIICIVLIS